MRLVARLTELIEGEADGAREYARLALELRGDGMQGAAATVLEMARQEAKHAESLHDVAVSAINARRDAGDAAPSGMEEYWEWRHGALIERMALAKQEIELCK